MKNTFLWMLLSLVLAAVFAYAEILIIAVAISNTHYSLYFALTGAAGLLCWLRALKSLRRAVATMAQRQTVSSFAFKAASLFFFGALALGFLGLLANIYFLILGKMS